MDWLERIWQQQTSPLEAAAFVVVVTTVLATLAAAFFMLCLLALRRGRAALAATLCRAWRWVQSGWNWLEPAIAGVTFGVLCATIIVKNALITLILNDATPEVAQHLCSRVSTSAPPHPLCSAALGVSVDELLSALSGALPNAELLGLVRDLARLYDLDALWLELRTWTVGFLVVGVLLLALRVGSRDVGPDAVPETLTANSRSVLLLALCTALLWCNLRAFSSEAAVARSVMATHEWQAEAPSSPAREALRNAAYGVPVGAIEASLACTAACSRPKPEPTVPSPTVPIPPTRPPELTSPGFLSVDGSAASDRSVSVQRLDGDKSTERASVPRTIVLPVGEYLVTSKANPDGQRVEIKPLQTTIVTVVTPPARSDDTSSPKPKAPGLQWKRLPSLLDAASALQIYRPPKQPVQPAASARAPIP